MARLLYHARMRRGNHDDQAWERRQHELAQVAIRDLVTRHFPAFVRYVQKTTSQGHQGDVLANEGFDFLKEVLTKRDLPSEVQEYDLYFAALCFELAAELYGSFDEQEHKQTVSHYLALVHELLEQPYNSIVIQRERLADLHVTSPAQQNPELEADAHHSIARSYLSSLEQDTDPRLTHIIRSAGMQHLARAVALFTRAYERARDRLEQEKTPQALDDYVRNLTNRARVKNRLAHVAVELKAFSYARDMAQAAIDDYQTLRSIPSHADYTKDIRDLQILIAGLR